MTRTTAADLSQPATATAADPDQADNRRRRLRRRRSPRRIDRQRLIEIRRQQREVGDADRIVVTEVAA
jgi:hypothetical protein